MNCALMDRSGFSGCSGNRIQAGEWHLKTGEDGPGRWGNAHACWGGSIEHLCPSQVHNTAFNRGKLRNVGFWEAMQEEEWDCVFFHDVNLLPEDDRNLYICDIFPAHVSVAIDKFNYK